MFRQYNLMISIAQAQNSLRLYKSTISVEKNFYACDTHERDGESCISCRKPNRSVELSFAILYSWRSCAVNDMIERILIAE